MAPKKFTESDGITQWVNTSTMNKPRFKLKEKKTVDFSILKNSATTEATSTLRPTINEPSIGDKWDGVTSAETVQDNGFEEADYPKRKRKGSTSFNHKKSMKTKNLDKIRKIKITCPNGKKQKDVLTLKPCTIPTAEMIRTVGAQRVRLEKRYGDAKTAMILDYIAFCVSKPGIQAI